MTRPPAKSGDARTPRCLLILLAAATGLAGYYGPWVAHRVAGLVIMGLDLAEYVKFLPQVLSGPAAIQREIFYLPLFAASVTASLFASRRCVPTWLRWALAFLAAPLALAMLPPAWSPGLLRMEEFRIQVLAIAVCLLLIPGVVLTRYLPDWLILLIVAFLALLAAIGPTWAFLQVRAAVDQVYRRPPAVGWGFWSSLVGFLGAAFLAIAELLRPESRRKAR
jgi:uncharacterized membrane protein YidH (DUF202 family)